MNRCWAIVGFALLAACGQTGALYLPNGTTESPVEIRPMEPAPPSGSAQTPPPAPPADSHDVPTRPADSTAPSTPAAPVPPADAQGPSGKEHEQGEPSARQPAQ